MKKKNILVMALSLALVAVVAIDCFSRHHSLKSLLKK